MLHRFRFFLLTIGLGVALGGLAAPVSVGAIDLVPECPGGASDSQLCGSSNNEEATSLAENLIGLLLFIIGIVSVVMIVIGGFRYVTSNGDANKIAAAKNTILYSVTGLIVAILASFIVNTVVEWFR